MAEIGTATLRLDCDTSALDTARQRVREATREMQRTLDDLRVSTADGHVAPGRLTSLERELPAGIDWSHCDARWHTARALCRIADLLSRR